jgi:hypothetical protein
MSASASSSKIRLPAILGRMPGTYRPTESAIQQGCPRGAFTARFTQHNGQYVWISLATDDGVEVWSCNPDFFCSWFTRELQDIDQEISERLERMTVRTQQMVQLIKDRQAQRKLDNEHAAAIAKDVREGKRSDQIRDEIIAKVGMIADARTPEMQARYDAALAQESGQPPPYERLRARIRELETERAQMLPVYEQYLGAFQSRAEFEKALRGLAAAIAARKAEEDRVAGLTEHELHCERRHPDYEYLTTENVRKQDGGDPPPNEGWEPNNIVLEIAEGYGHPARYRNWERFELTESNYWKRRKPRAPEVAQ